MTRRLLAECVRLVQSHAWRHPQRKCYMHYSFVVQNDKLIEWDTNKVGSPPIYFGYGPVAKLHSELCAYRKARGLLEGFQWELVNVRINRQGRIKISAPCVVCRGWLSTLGCQDVWFSLNEGGWAKC